MGLNKRCGNFMKILVIGDLHGQNPRLHFKKFDAIICTGDVCTSKYIWKHFKVSYEQFLKNPKEHQSWYELIGKTKAKKLIKDSLFAGRKVLKKLNALDVPVYIIPGNWDFFYDGEKDDWDYLNKNYYVDYLIKGLRNVHDCHKKNIIVKDGQSKYTVIGYGTVNGPELLKYRHYDNVPRNKYKKNALKYKRSLSQYSKIFLKTKNPKILLSHNVPFNTPLDIMNNKDSPMDGYHYGSNLARDIITRHKPILCIAGHMHEHYGTCRIGKTLVLNAGYGGEKNTLIELERGKIKDIKFHGKKK
jgi:Icc-related predicted phosphoesterase